MSLRKSMVNRGLLILTCFFSFVIQLCLASKTRHFKWEVEYMYWSPDCMEGVVMGINGQFPGPTIRAVAGDTIVVELTNRLHTEGGRHSLAWNQTETFIYRYKVDKAGTYFYHGHYGMQRSAGLYGSLIVEVGEGQKEPFHYDGEFNLLLSDWWHKGSQEQEVALLVQTISLDWRTPGNVNLFLSLFSTPLTVNFKTTLLINGRGQYNCSLAAHVTNSSSPQCQFRGNEQCAPRSSMCSPIKLTGSGSPAPPHLLH
ncbi:L-ascorbate oxidase [Vitis vinifera]|uniref:L-ascorbate oxidase n=1 Tax=Vitis vinifera TaxID=29760 RepID=A0A438GCR4_VITVI|nr:L-ascorbate oxidase [Vitis vinifera]